MYPNFLPQLFCLWKAACRRRSQLRAIYRLIDSLLFCVCERVMVPSPVACHGRLQSISSWRVRRPHFHMSSNHLLPGRTWCSGTPAMPSIAQVRPKLSSSSSSSKTLWNIFCIFNPVFSLFIYYFVFKIFDHLLLSLFLNCLRVTPISYSFVWFLFWGYFIISLFCPIPCDLHTSYSI